MQFHWDTGRANTASVLRRGDHRREDSRDVPKSRIYLFNICGDFWTNILINVLSASVPVRALSDACSILLLEFEF